MVHTHKLVFVHTKLCLRFGRFVQATTIRLCSLVIQSLFDCVYINRPFLKEAVHLAQQTFQPPNKYGETMKQNTQGRRSPFEAAVAQT